jgi:hypothetical protein
MKQDKLIPLLLLMAGLVMAVSSIMLFVVGNWLARYFA